MVIFAVVGGVIVVLAASLAWRDHLARRRGSQVRYQGRKALQNRADAQTTAHNPLITGKVRDRAAYRRPRH